MATIMAAGKQAGTVQVVIGEVKIIGVDGVARIAQIGDSILVNELLATSSTHSPDSRQWT